MDDTPAAHHGLMEPPGWILREHTDGTWDAYIMVPLETPRVDSREEAEQLARELEETRAHE